MRIHRKVANWFGYELTHNRRHPTFSTHLANLIKRYQIEVVLDVGAHEGEFASELRREGFRGQIHSFEPGSEAYTNLAAAAERDPAWHAHPFALGAEAGSGALQVAGTGDLSSFLEPSAFGTERFVALAERRSESVQVRTLDEVLPELNCGQAPILLKMDTQGSDLKVFAGAQASLQTIRALASELSLVPLYEGMPHYLEALATYESAGYRVTGLYPVCRDRSSLALIEVDCVLVRDDSSAT